MTGHYVGREQTEAKHFILRKYLQALAFKVLRFSDITYVDGFSGPWKTRTVDFADSSFMIAISVLREAQAHVAEQTGRRPRVHCFFCEKERSAYEKLTAAVAPFHKPDEGFEVETYCGEFEGAVTQIQRFIGQSFPLIFIDPTGWTGFSFDKIKTLFQRRKCEVLINFMYDFVNWASSMKRSPGKIASLNPILGGPDWEARLDPTLPRGQAIEKLFRDSLRNAGNFDFVVSTKIDRATADRPHFFIAYATKADIGLREFREVEYRALREHARRRSAAKERKREDATKLRDLFAGIDADVQEATIDDIVEDQKALASDALIAALGRFGRPVSFEEVWIAVLEGHMLRVTNVKDICVDLAKAGKIDNTWGGGNRKPKDDDIIRLANRVQS